MKRATAHPRDLGLACLLVLAGCGARIETPAPSGTDRPAEVSEATPEVDLRAAEARLAAFLDPGDRELLALIDPAEALEATIDVPGARLVADAARATGFHADVVNDGTVQVLGPRNDVVAFAAGLQLTAIIVAEDHRVDRWLPEVRPDVEMPSPGTPYPFGGLDPDLSRVTMSEDRRRVLLSDLALTTVTIDGRPYARLTVDGGCDPGPPNGPLCQLWAHGSTAGAGGREDELLVSLDTGTGLHKVEGANRGSVPRSLVRAAEWIARHDAGATRVVSRYTTCCFATWDPGQPGVITIGWTRECAAAARPPQVELADTGDCSDRLDIVVDVGRTTVVSIAEVAGP